MIKELPQHEFNKLLLILNQYYMHIFTHHYSLISRFFGLHEIKWRDSSGTKFSKYLVVMNNVFKYQDFDIGVRFDLKGSSVDRTHLPDGTSIADHKDVTIALKDNDFRTHVGKLTFIESGDRPSFHSIV